MKGSLGYIVRTYDRQTDSRQTEQQSVTVCDGSHAGGATGTSSSPETSSQQDQPHPTAGETEVQEVKPDHTPAFRGAGANPFWDTDHHTRPASAGIQVSGIQKLRDPGLHWP